MDESIGGFHLKVTSDPFTGTATVDTPLVPERQPGAAFPYVTDPPLTVPSGTYLLTVWAGLGLGPYTRWVPSATSPLQVCDLIVTVNGDTSVTLTGLKPMADPVAACTPTLGSGPGTGDVGS